MWLTRLSRCVLPAFAAAGLVDDDFGMELLVGGSIIALGLPVNDVVELHWWPRHQQQQQQHQRSSSAAGQPAAGAAAAGSAGGPPPGVAMPITFRLSGLDGEATEPLVKDLNPAPSAQSLEQEQELAGVLAQHAGRGLGVLLQLLLLAQQLPLQALRWVRGQVLQLLKAAVKLQPCRDQLLALGALGTLLHLVHLACKPLLEAAQHRSASTGPAAAGELGGGMSGAQLLLLLEALEALVTAANTSGRPVLLDSAPPPAAGPEEAEAQQQQQRETAAEQGAAAALAALPSSSSSVSSPSAAAAAAACASSSAMEVAQLADGLSVLELAGLGNCAAVLARLLTALAQHSSAAQLGLLQHFAPALDLKALDAACPAAAAAAGGGRAAAVAGAEEAAAAVAEGVAASEGSEVDIDDDEEEEAEEEEGEEEEGGGAGSGQGGVVVLSVVHAAADGALSAVEHRLQLQGFLRLTEALSSSSRDGVGSNSKPGDSAGGTSRRLSSATGAQPQAAEAPAPEARQEGKQSASFKQLVLQHGIPTLLASYLVDVFTQQQEGPADREAGGTAALVHPGTDAWSAAAAKPGVPFALRLLTALASGHAPTATALAADAPQLLQLLHWLEGTAGGSTLTPLAEACLEAVAGAGDGGVAAAVEALRAATAAEMKAKAAKKREALLASLGMVQVEAGAEAGGGFKILPSPAGVPALSPLAAELAALEASVEDDEASGGACMVCREGYSLQPTTLLGCYCYCRVAAAAEWPGCCPPWSTPYDLIFTSVSHFNVIHINCHAAAKAADASLRQPKREWQGATLRNGNVLCNALLPLAVPAAGQAETAYAAAVAAFWQQQLAAPSASEAAAAAGGSTGPSGRGSGSGDAGMAAATAVNLGLSRRCAAFRESDSSLLRVSLVAADIATLLQRFAYQLSFSEESRGGGRASNARLLLALMQLGRCFVVEAAADELEEAQQLLATASKAAAALKLEAAPAATESGSSSGAGAAGVSQLVAATTVGSGGTGSVGGGGSSSSQGSGGSASGVTGCSAEDVAELCSCAAFVLGLSLLLSSPAEWMAGRRSMLAVAVRHGVGRWVQSTGAEGGGAASSSSSSKRGSRAGGSSSSSGGLATAVAGLSDVQLYEAAAPMVRLFGMVDWLQQWAKPAVSAGSGSGGWAAAMAAGLRDLAGCSQAAGELLEVVDEGEEALGLQDLVDSQNLLGVVLGAPGVGGCEDFVRRVCAEI